MNNVLSISGGKDSTAMLIKMLEHGEKIHSAVFFDTGWEFPAMYDHIEKLQQYTGIKIWTLHPRLPFEYWLMARPIATRKGENKGKIKRIGNGWPSPSRRWCTREKVNVLLYYMKPIKDAIQCIGYASDESDRSFHDNNISHRFPLQEYKITEADALKICYEHGFDWGGLYNYFKRVSCFCCPLQSIDSLKILRYNFPKLWDYMLKIEDKIPIGSNRRFRGEKKISDLERFFNNEDKKLKRLENFQKKYS